MARRITVSSALVAVGCAVATVSAAPASASAATPIWPAQGQAAYVLGDGRILAGPHPHEAPIASVAKVMTAYLVLTTHPLAGAANGFTMTVTSADVADWRRRVARGESTVPVRAGERIDERQALAALLLPSANNIAVMLARRVSGRVTSFVRLMNSTARSMGMQHTVYTDPSGFDAGTRSIPADQVRLALRVVRIGFFDAMVDRATYRIPVAGTIHNTDTLLRHDGFVGIKTGSDSAAGGCFLFRSNRLVHGRPVTITGIVMGQYAGNLIEAGLSAAKRLVDRVAPRSR